ncbi:MAG TPA: ribosomal L7Ae/L30e/S12e/Gadd45 family protein [Clostridia bacterium]|nr:ribosomal L7Ae/L30e/S12e/Gadd45 family protein [Clostridia bacterium]
MDVTLTKFSRENLVVGYRQVVRGLSSGNIRCVVIASDTDIGIKNELATLCQDKKVPCRVGTTKAETGKLIGLDVACAVYAETEVTR